jgi:hypothetical protein
MNEQINEPFTGVVEQKLKSLYFWKYLYTFSRPNVLKLLKGSLTFISSTIPWEMH